MNYRCICVYQRLSRTSWALRLIQPCLPPTRRRTPLDGEHMTFGQQLITAVAGGGLVLAGFVIGALLAGRRR